MKTEYLNALEKQPPVPLGERDRHYNGFLYGEYGVGKTKEAAECVKNKGLLLWTDNGYETLYNHPHLVDKFHIMQYDGLSQLSAIGEAVTEKETVGGINYGELDLILVDTVGQVQDDYLDWLMENYNFTTADSRVKAIPSKKGKANGLVDTVEITGLADYHMVRNQMRKPIRSLVKAPVNVIFIAHLREPNFLEQSKGKITKRPLLTETVFKMLARDCSWMGLMEKKGTKREIEFNTDVKQVAKSRVKELNDKKINAEDLSKILKKWTGQE
jgi:hypothetical protein